MERLRRRESEERPPAPPLVAVAATPVALPELPSPPTVQVIWGPVVETFSFVGMAVREVRNLLSHLRIAPRAEARVDGHPVSPGHRLAPGEVLEFYRPFREKGAAG